MRYLLDTHTLLWARSAPDRLSAEALSVLQAADNALYVSITSLWECAIKASIGKLSVPAEFYRLVANEYETLGIDVPLVEACASLPLHHRDPFDRLLVAQAQLAGLILVTRDRNIARYDVPTVVA